MCDHVLYKERLSASFFSLLPDCFVGSVVLAMLPVSSICSYLFTALSISRSLESVRATPFSIYWLKFFHTMYFDYILCFPSNFPRSPSTCLPTQVKCLFSLKQSNHRNKLKTKPTNHPTKHKTPKEKMPKQNKHTHRKW